MFILANVLQGIAAVLELFLQIYMFIILGRVIISWVNADPYNPIVRFLVRATEPLFWRVKRWIPWATNVGGLDFTPLFVLALIFFLQYALVGNLYELVQYLKT